ncbi:DUF481 domain-containing protein [secondary endosymbiont of Ctenarytaina eucalypti]|uniref:Putative salt-induced outer membrane protein n=1 Tax=secondary endosymbiont of Ctenarytaina eucalypti TaxID=1199245 RepID=J3Z439_9ENTR|nr:DUF481 domain-containing protein [secondary endosymbiont of Ctenarytaina eucalypti]AFP85039.1 putative salt-induced outer membrane protein [secondary endosymbiont of Ctenarytaina eucalypti]
MKKKMIYSLALMPIASFSAFADTDVFMVIDDPATTRRDFEGNFETNYNAQSGNISKSNLSINTTLTFFQTNNAYSAWGAVDKNAEDDHLNLEKYKAGARARHNINDDHYLFTQADWLGDRFNGYRSRNTFIGGYGRQILKAQNHNLRLEAGPGMRHDEHDGGGRMTQALVYGSAAYTYQLSNYAKFTQGLSIFANGNAMIHSETALNVDINNHFSLLFAHNITWNKMPIRNATKETDIKTSLSLVYRI